MDGRGPSPILVVEANIIVSAALGLRSGPALARVGERRRLATSARAAEEVASTVRCVTEGNSVAAELVQSYIDLTEMAPADLYAPDLEVAAARLRDAIASRDGGTGDAHVLALAWTLAADLWSQDRDFSGTGWPSWSSANLLAHLAGKPAAAEPA